MEVKCLAEQLEAFCEKNQLFGMLRVTWKDRVVHRQSFGWADREKRQTFSEESLFTLYSMSKPFCAMGLLLKKETWEQVLTPSPVNNKGFGCTVTQWHGKLRITHNGGHRGFRTLHIYLPEEDVDVILLSNSGYCNSGRSEIAEMVYRAFLDPDSLSEKPLEMDTGYI